MKNSRFFINAAVILLVIMVSSCATVRPFHASFRGRIDISDPEIAREKAVVQIVASYDAGPWYFYTDRISSYSTGFFINEAGYVLTCYHCVADEGEDKEDASDDAFPFLFVNFEGKSYPAELIAYDIAEDLAVIKIDARRPVPCVRFADIGIELESGDFVTVFAKPPHNDSWFEVELRKTAHYATADDCLEIPEIKCFYESLDLGVPDTCLQSSVDKYATDAHIAFTNDGKDVKGGSSGGACFNDDGLCIGMVQYVVFYEAKEAEGSEGATGDRHFLAGGANISGIIYFLLVQGIEYHAE